MQSRAREPILSLNDLSARISVPLPRLYDVADNIKSHYSRLPLVNGAKVRHLWVPSPELKAIQRRINRKILGLIPIGDAVHGGVRFRSPRTNAGQHLGQPRVVNIDVKEFYPSVHHDVICRLFVRELGYGRDVARVLTKLTTFRSELPQGAPTSTTLANLLLAATVDTPLSSEARRRGIRYTRFVDDIVLSGADPKPLINTAARLLSTKGLTIHRKKAKFQQRSKLKITPRSRPQEVTGLLVNSCASPSLSRRKRENIRAAVFELLNVNDVRERERSVASIRGRIAYVRQFNSGSADRLQRQLNQTLARCLQR